MAGQPDAQRVIRSRAVGFGLLLLLAAGPSTARDGDVLRVAAYNVSFSRSGPGVLYKDITKGEDPQIAAVIAVLAQVRPDIVLLNQVDYDAGGAALDALQGRLAGAGLDYPHSFSAPSNTGWPTGEDLDGDGTVTGPEDAHGYGRFPGQYGMAILSRYPMDTEASRTFQTLLWADFPGALLPVDAAGGPFPSAAAHRVLRLSSKSHWDVAVDTPRGRLHLLAAHPTPPVFDGPEDFNGRRNHDEITFWTTYLDGWNPTDDQGRSAPMADAPFVVLGDLNADPEDGDGLRDGIRALLGHPRLQDPRPTSAGGVAAARAQGGANTGQRGDPALDTADWRDSGGPGNLRADYVLPSASVRVLAAGVHWPGPGAPGHALVGSGEAVSSDHRLVWVDIALP